MQPTNKEMQALNSILNKQQQQQQQQQICIEELQQVEASFDPTSSHDHYLAQMLSSTSWPLENPNKSSLPWDLGENDQSAFLASKLRQQQITGAGENSPEMLDPMLLLSELRSPAGDSVAGDTNFRQMNLSQGSGDSFDPSHNDVFNDSAFKSQNQGGDSSIQALYNGFAGSLHGSGNTSNHPQHFHHPQAQNYVTPPAPAMIQSPASAPSQPRQRVRARRGQATDPHSIAERLRRERIAERMKGLQELVPNANKTDKASMLDEIIDYVKFLQLQVKVLSMSRLGGAGAVAPLVADISSEGGGDCIQTRNSNTSQTPRSNDGMTVTEHQVAKLMEEDMGSAMQYLQGKGLCLMPISLATAISTINPIRNHHPLLSPSSPSTISVLTVQSATHANAKDTNSVSKP